jgi:type I restriction enzyme S subunit
MIAGDFIVYGGGGFTTKTHNKFNVSYETLGIGRVGARCGCVFKIDLNSWVTDNALYATKINEKFDLNFLIHYLNYKNILQYANTSAQPVISLKRISHITIPSINIDLQREIVRTLNEVENGIIEIKDDKFKIKETFKLINSKEMLGIELTHQLDLVKQLRQSFLREAMQGKLLAKAENKNITIPPAKAGGYLLNDNTSLSENEINRNGFQPIRNENNPIGFSQTGQQLLEKIKAEKAQLIAEKKIKKEKPLAPITKEEIPFEIPDHWAWCRLGEIAYITSGSTPSKESFVESGIPYLKMYNLRNQKIDFFYKPQYIKEEVHNGQLKRCRAYSGDVIMNIVGPPLGKIAIIPDSIAECNFNQAAVLIRPLFKSMNFFIFWYLNEMSEIKSIDTKGVAGQANISVTQSHNMKITLPPLHEQEQIVAKLEELMGFCDGLEQSIKESQEYNEMLLQQVLREALQGEEV